MRFFWLFIYFLIGINISWAQDEKILNLYAWTGEIPDAIVQQFEQETGIKVHFSTYENNEIMYTKLKAAKDIGYDLVMPSSYYVDRMRKQGMLQPIQKNQLAAWRNLNPQLINPSYDPGSNFSLPFLWGITGIFVNEKYFSPQQISKWSDLWQPRFKNQLMLLDDTREIFSMALLSLGYSANDANPQHIAQAYNKLKQLMSNIKVFSSDTVVSIMIDEDATVGMAWNGDAFKAASENPQVKFIFPQDKFVIWVDTFAIPKYAPHLKAAYKFLNYILRPEIAKKIALATSYATANQAAQNLLPAKIKHSPVIYPSAKVLQKGEFQTDVSDATLALYEKYWAELKMSA